MRKERGNLRVRLLAFLLTAAMVLAMGGVSVFAEESADQTASGFEDGVYRITVNLWNATQDQASMGNASIRGSQSYNEKHAEDDPDHQALLIVQDGRGVVIMEYMAMGFMGTYGYLLQLDTLENIVYHDWNFPSEYTLKPAQVLAEHRMTDGSIAVDNYNDPESEYVLEAANGKAYPHILAVPVDLPDEPVTQSWDESPWVHVFVPVMYAISPSSGDQLARLVLDYSNMTKVEDLSGEVEYWLYQAMQLTRGTASDEKWQALQGVIAETKDKLSNTLVRIDLLTTGTGTPMAPVPVRTAEEMDETERKEQAAKLQAAMEALTAADPADPSGLQTVLGRAAGLDESIYTEESWQALMTEVQAGQALLADGTATTEQMTEQAQKIADAIEALETRKADYTAVDQAIAGANALNPDDYVDFSAVTAAVGAVVRDKPASEQAEVDAMAQAILDAIGALEKKNTALDRYNLADGVYSVEGTMVKAADKTAYSMSNDAINHTMKLEVRDGQYQITMDFKGLTIGSQFGYLGTLRYFASGYTVNQYGIPEGTLEDVTVLSYQTNADGTAVSDRFSEEYGLQYPDVVTFPLIPEAMEEGYVPLQVFVPIMENISDGTGPQQVYLKLDWSTLKATTADDPGFTDDDEPEQNGTEETPPAGTGNLANNTNRLPSASGSSLKNSTAAARKTGSTVYTGDTAPTALWAGLALAAAAVSAAVLYQKKKSSRE